MADMKYYHCGNCGKYVSPDDGFYGVAERKDGGMQRIYCSRLCCEASEGVYCERNPIT